MATTRIIRNAKLVLPDRILAPGWLEIRDDRIAGLGPEPLADVPAGAEILDVSGCFVVPGFIDVHIHGFLHRSVQEGPDAIRAMSAALPAVGVTSFLPTLMPLPSNEFPDFVRAAADATLDPPGARMPGLHLEGPFLARTGAIRADVIQALDRQYLERLIDAAAGRMAAMSVSPDFPDAIPFALRVKESGAHPFVTHTQATFDQTVEFLNAIPDAHATHFYDVFHQPEWHEPGTTPVGAVEAFLLNDRATVDFIADGVHVHPALVRLALKVKGVDHCALCTDANIGAGLPHGEYPMPDGTVIVISDAGGAREKGRNWLMGSALTMSAGLRNLVELIGLNLCEAARMAATVPAWILGLDDRGSIQKRLLADLAVLDDAFEVQYTLVGGRIVYRP